MIAVVNLGISNTGSVCKALTFIGAKYKLVDTPEELNSAKKVLLPGVGNFHTGMQALKSKNLIEVLRKKSLRDKVPFFGVCLGMQLMFDFGEEGGGTEGLALIKGNVIKLKVDRDKFTVPHIGWNDVQANGMKMFNEIAPDSCFYFVHSFEADCTDPLARVASVEYGNHSIVAAVEKGSIWAAQFHPERSQKVGLQILKNFSELPC